MKRIFASNFTENRRKPVFADRGGFGLFGGSREVREGIANDHSGPAVLLAEGKGSFSAGEGVG